MIYHISIGIKLDFAEITIMNHEDINNITDINATSIHIFVKDTSLYQPVLDKIHSIYMHIQIITISFDDTLECNYHLKNTNIHMKHYTLPDRYQLDKQVQATLAYKLNEYHISFNDIEDFMTYLGIDQKHLRENLSYKNEYSHLSLEEYCWKDVFGKKSTIDLLKYLQESEEYIQKYFTSKQNTIINRFVNVIDEVLKQYFNSYTYIYVLNPNNNYSLYQLISQISQMNIQNLSNIYKETVQSFKDKYESTQSSKGLFSHKEEKLDDLLQTSDTLIAQSYEIHRFQSMKTIYNQILEYLKNIQMAYPKDAYDYHIPIDFYDAFISRFMETKNFNCYKEFTNYPYIYQQMFQRYDYQIIVSKYELYHGIECKDMLENECDIYY